MLLASAFTCYHAHVKLVSAVQPLFKWACAWLTVLMAVMWIGSRWYCLMWDSPAGGCIAVQGGLLGVAEPLWVAGAPGYGVVWFEPLNVELQWWFRWGRWNGGRDAAAPLWIPTLAALGMTIVAWRHDVAARHRLRAGACQRCGYSRSGLMEKSPCPECGATALKP